VITAADEQRVLDSVPHGLLIGGEWGAADGRPEFPVEDPSTGEELTRIADAGEAEARAAFDAAVAAQPAWAATAPRERGEILRRAFERSHRRPTTGAALTLEWEARADRAPNRLRRRRPPVFSRSVRVAASRPPRVISAPDQRRPVPALLITPWTSRCVATAQDRPAGPPGTCSSNPRTTL